MLLWPLILLFVLLYFGKPLQQFANNMREFTFKAPEVEATAKRQQIEVATLLGAATARQSTPSDGQQTVGKHAGGDLWVDDRPENNIFERRAGSSWCSFHAEYVY